MRREGRLDPVPWSSVLPRAAGRLADAADLLRGMRHEFIHGPTRRWFASRRACVQAERGRCAGLLHLGTYDVPVRPVATRHYMYVDNTYDLWESQSRAARELSARKRRGFRQLEARALRQLRHVFTAGEHVARNLVDAFGVPPERVTAVGTGLGGISPYHGPKDYTTGRLLVVAKARRHDKGLPLLLDAFEVARKTRPDLQLTVVGGEGFPGLAGRPGVHGVGWIEAADLQRLFEEATLYVMPASYEPWGLAYLEALACRTPVVGLRRNALPEITDQGRHGFLLERPDAQALAATLLHALADPAALERIGREGQRHCLSRYCWDTIATRIADVIGRDAREAA